MDDSEQIKEVYAHVGLAIHNAQLVEQTLVNMFIAAKLPERDRGIDRANIDVFIEERYSKTMGRLINDLKRVYNLSDLLIEKLNNALKIRNMLTHKFFRERATTFITSKGRDEMLHELYKINDQFGNLDKELTALYNDVSRKNGITQKMVDTEMKRLLEGSQEKVHTNSHNTL